MTYTITNNTEFNSIEILFDGKPSEAVRTALKALRFRWHKVKGVWYGYTDEATARRAIDNQTADIADTAKSAHGRTTAAKAVVNEYGVQVGDIFEASWGYEQTNVDFFQVVELVGKQSVRVREVHLQMVDESPTCPMASDRTYAVTRELQPALDRSVFIKDQERGDLKRLRKYGDSVSVSISSYASAYLLKGDTTTVYESWYY